MDQFEPQSIDSGPDGHDLMGFYCNDCLNFIWRNRLIFNPMQAFHLQYSWCMHNHHWQDEWDVFSCFTFAHLPEEQEQWCWYKVKSEPWKDWIFHLWISFHSTAPPAIQLLLLLTPVCAWCSCKLFLYNPKSNSSGWCCISEHSECPTKAWLKQTQQKCRSFWTFYPDAETWL